MERLEPTHLEKTVLEFFCAGHSVPLATLRAQIPHLCVVERKGTGVGFFTTFDLPAQAQRLPTRACASLGQVWADNIPDVESGASFVLWVDDGAIKTLEGATFEGPWKAPAHTTTFTLRYVYERRDLAEVDVALGHIPAEQTDSAT